MIETNIKIDEETKPLDFPKLMIVDNKEWSTVILATSSDNFGIEGVVISTSNKCNILGEFSKNWCNTSFEDFKGELTLTNKK